MHTPNDKTVVYTHFDFWVERDANKSSSPPLSSNNPIPPLLVVVVVMGAVVVLTGAVDTIGCDTTLESSAVIPGASSSSNEDYNKWQHKNNTYLLSQNPPD